MINKESEDNKKLEAKLKYYDDEEMTKLLKEKEHYQKELEYTRHQMIEAIEQKKSLPEKDKGIRGRKYKIAK